MVCQKAFKNKLLIGLCAFIISFSLFPASVFASNFAGTTLYFSSGDVLLSDSQVIMEQTNLIQLPSPLNGKYELVFGFFHNNTYQQVSGITNPSYTTEFRLVVDGVEYSPVYDLYDNVYHFYFDAKNLSRLGLKWILTFWGGADTQQTSANFSTVVTINGLYFTTISGPEQPDYTVEDKQGNLLLDQILTVEQGQATLITRGNELQEEANAMQSQEIQLQEEANQLQEEANETGKSLLEKVTDFFDNFFSRLGEFLLGLIVPSADELTVFLDEVNDWFGERLGFIWYPFSFAVDMVSALANGTAETGFQVPEFKLDILGTEYQIWPGMTVDMDAFGIFRYVRIFTSFLLVAGIVKLAYDKWDEWIGGHGVG